MSQRLSNQGPASPKSCSAISSPRNGILDEGLWLKTKGRGDPKKCKQTFDQGTTETYVIVIQLRSITSRHADQKKPVSFQLHAIMGMVFPLTNRRLQLRWVLSKFPVTKYPYPKTSRKPLLTWLLVFVKSRLSWKIAEQAVPLLTVTHVERLCSLRKPQILG